MVHVRKPFLRRKKCVDWKSLMEFPRGWGRDWGVCPVLGSIHVKQPNKLTSLRELWARNPHFLFAHCFVQLVMGHNLVKIQDLNRSSPPGTAFTRFRFYPDLLSIPNVFSWSSHPFTFLTIQVIRCQMIKKLINKNSCHTLEVFYWTSNYNPKMLLLTLLKWCIPIVGLWHLWPVRAIKK